MERQKFGDQPLKHQIETLKVSSESWSSMRYIMMWLLWRPEIRWQLTQVIENDYTIRSQLSEIYSKVTVDVAGDDVGLVMRQSLNDASRGEGTRNEDLKLLRNKIEELETELEKQKKIDEVKKHCQGLIDAAQRILEHPDNEGGEDDGKAKLKDHHALEEIVTSVWNLYKGADIKVEKKEEVKSNKRRRIQGTRK